MKGQNSYKAERRRQEKTPGLILVDEIRTDSRRDHTASQTWEKTKDAPN